MAEEPRGFCLPVSLVTTPEDQSAPLRGLGEGHFEGHEALGGEGGPPCACIAWGRTSTDIRSWLDHPQRWRATFFFFFLVVIGTSPERSLLAPVSEQSAGRSGLRDQLVPAILSACPALPCPALRQLLWLPDPKRCQAPSLASAGTVPCGPFCPFHSHLLCLRQAVFFRSADQGTVTECALMTMLTLVDRFLICRMGVGEVGLHERWLAFLLAPKFCGIYALTGGGGWGRSDQPAAERAGEGPGAVPTWLPLCS